VARVCVSDGSCIRIGNETHVLATFRKEFVENVAKKGQKEGKSGPNVQKEVKKCSKRGPFYYRFFSTCRIKFHFSLLVK